MSIIIVTVKCRGGKSTNIPYNIINCHARVSHKDRIHEKLGLQLSLLHYIYDRMGFTEGGFEV